MTPQPIPDPIPLNKGKLCVNCEAVYVGQSCPACTSKIFIFLGRALGTVKEEESDQPGIAVE